MEPIATIGLDLARTFFRCTASMVSGMSSLTGCGNSANFSADSR